MQISKLFSFILLVPYFAGMFVIAITIFWFTLIGKLIMALFHFILGSYRSKKDSTSAKQNLVILGTGWSSFYLLMNLDHEKYNTTVISPRDHFLFTPLLCSTTVGTLESTSVIESVLLRAAKKFKFIQGGAFDVDLNKKTLLYRKGGSKFNINFDRLVIGIGSTTNTFGITGVEEHAFPLKEAVHAQAIRRRLNLNIQSAISPHVDDDTRKRLLTVVVVGGGPTGVEFAAELMDFVKQDGKILLGDYLSAVKIVIVERSGVLASFDTKLQNYVTDLIAKERNINIIKSRVVKVLPGAVLLDDGTEISCGLTVWTAGIAQQSFVKQLPLDKADSGRILVDGNMSVVDENFKHEIYALGDCSYISSNPQPCTAQVAYQQGEYLASLLNKSSEPDFKSTASNHAPFVFKPLGVMAYVGGNRAIVTLLPIGLNITGFPAFLIWRCGYLFRFASWRQRLQVPIDWLKTYIFGRELSVIS